MNYGQKTGKKAGEKKTEKKTGTAGNIRSGSTLRRLSADLFHDRKKYDSGRSADKRDGSRRPDSGAGGGPGTDRL